MHKDFYASGFLYHLPTQQILLQQPSSLKGTSSWTIFLGKNKKKEEATLTFQRLILEQLHLKLPISCIHSVYDYFHKELAKNHYTHYAEVKTISPKIHTPRGYVIGWFTFKQLYKLTLSEQTRQDIIVAQRVINAAERKLTEGLIL